jgi:redox-sensitive bicupin YhaK (pirin superfamily)
MQDGTNMANSHFGTTRKQHALAAGARRISHRTRGETKGSVTQLVGPSDLGQLLKPFVLLSYIDFSPETHLPVKLHAHSGIASVGMLIDGSLHLRDSQDAPVTLDAGGMEWMCSGSGIWHGSAFTVSGHMRGFQMWMSLAPEFELTQPREQFLRPDEVPQAGCARILLGRYGGLQSPIDAPWPITYLHVRLSAGDDWHYEPPRDHDVLWIVLHSGSLDVGSTVEQGELVIFEDGNQAVEIRALADCEFLLGSALRSPYDVVQSSGSIHASADALRRAQMQIERLAGELRKQGRLPA